MRSPITFLAAAVSLALGGCAASPARPPVAAAPVPLRSGPPKLVVAISVDQLSGDLFAQYREHFTGGFARLLQGAVFPSGFQSHAATETCPGHSTLLTGARPNRNGIIANMWFDPAIQRADKRVYCAEDEADPASSSANPVVSARHLRVPTLGDRLKAANPASRNVAVSAKDRAVVMMGGHAIDEAWWWKNGAFSSFAGKTVPPAVAEVNARAAALIKAGGPAYPVPTWCTSRDQAVPVGKTTIGTWRFPLEPGKDQAFRASPRMDGATVDLAIGLIDSMDLGKGSAPDVLSVSLSANDYIGHTFGTEGVEMCIQQAELDRSIGRLLDHLDTRGIDYMVVLSADHGGFDAPERLSRQALPRATRTGHDLDAKAIAAAITARTGIATTGPLIFSDGPSGDFYVSNDLSTIDKARVVQAMLAILRNHPQVAAAFTAQELADTPAPLSGPQEWSLRERARASFDPKRSGDVVVLLERAVVPIPDPGAGYVATHGSPWDYDRRVPILFWRRGLRGFEQPAPVETVDIAPSLAALLKLDVPDGGFDGRCLDIDGSEANTCDVQR